MKNVGIIGLGNIAHRVAKGILCSPKAYLYAVASRDIDKAQNFAHTYQAKTYYGSYEQLLKDENVDLVYICTPNQFHYEHIHLSLSYRKHVICEKPMVKNAEEIRALFAYARAQGCFLMEAEKTMFTPLNKKLKQMVQDGVIGKLYAIKAQYCYDVLKEVDQEHWVLDKDFGGCSYDIGVYPVSFSHYFANSNVSEMHIEQLTHPQFECDFGLEADIIYANQIYSNVKANWFYTSHNKGNALLIGDKGVIEVPAFWKGKQAFLYVDGEMTTIEVEMESDFEGEITHAIECIEASLLESPILGEKMSIAIIHAVENMQ